MAKLTHCDALATPIYKEQHLNNFATSVNHGYKLYINRDFCTKLIRDWKWTKRSFEIQKTAFGLANWAFAYKPAFSLSVGEN